MKLFSQFIHWCPHWVIGQADSCLAGRSGPSRRKSGVLQQVAVDGVLQALGSPKTYVDSQYTLGCPCTPSSDDLRMYAVILPSGKFFPRCQPVPHSGPQDSTQTWHHLKVSPPNIPTSQPQKPASLPTIMGI